MDLTKTLVATAVLPLFFACGSAFEPAAGDGGVAPPPTSTSGQDGSFDASSSPPDGSTHDAPTAPDTGDERRNYYRITSAGRRVARAEAQRLELLTRAARLGGLLPKGVK